MKLIIERVTSVTLKAVTKEPVAVLAVDLLPAFPGDDFWVIADGKRERHTILTLRMGVENGQVIAMIEIAVAARYPEIDLAMLVKARGDVELPPDASQHGGAPPPS